MGIFLIGLAILSLATLIFQYFWKAVLKYFYHYLLPKLEETVKKIIVATKRLGKVVMLLYRRHVSGRIYKTEYTEDVVDPEDVPEGLRDELGIHEEVVVKNDDINPSEF